MNAPYYYVIARSGATKQSLPIEGDCFAPTALAMTSNYKGNAERSFSTAGARILKNGAG